MRTDNNPLPEAIRKRIANNSKLLSHDTSEQVMYEVGAEIEARRALILIEALRKIDNMCDHDDYGNSASNCPACMAHVAIEEYNNPLP